MNNITADGLAGADEVIKAMQRMGHDYSAHRDRIALELFENGVWDGNYDRPSNSRMGCLLSGSSKKMNMTRAWMRTRSPTGTIKSTSPVAVTSSSPKRLTAHLFMLEQA
jgi:hypothetical protein